MDIFVEGNILSPDSFDLASNVPTYASQHVGMTAPTYNKIDITLYYHNNKDFQIWDNLGSKVKRFDILTENSSFNGCFIEEYTRGFNGDYEVNIVCNNYIQQDNKANILRKKRLEKIKNILEDEQE